MRFHIGRNAPNLKPGWLRKPRGKGYTVFLDGRLVNDVVAADTETGEVWVAQGKPGTGKLPVKLMGKVEVRTNLQHFHDEARAEDSESITP